MNCLVSASRRVMQLWADGAYASSAQPPQHRSGKTDAHQFVSPAFPGGRQATPSSTPSPSVGPCCSPPNVCLTGPLDVVQFRQPPDMYHPLGWVLRRLGSTVVVDRAGPHA